MMIMITTWPAHPNLLELTTLNMLGERYKLWNSSWSLLHFPFASLLGPNICLRILFSNILSLHSPLKISDHVFQTYSTTGNIIVLYILHIFIFKCLERSLEPLPAKLLCNYRKIREQYSYLHVHYYYFLS